MAKANPCRPACLALFLAFAVEADALSLASVEEALRSQPVLDTFEVKVVTQVQVRQHSITSRAHVISKGPGKLWMEQEGPGSRLRTVRNGSKAMTVDLQTGARQALDLEALASLPNASSPALPLLRQGRYESPRDIGGNRYRIDLVPGTDTTVVSRSFTYDAGARCISRITQVGRSQDTVATDLTFTTVDGRMALSKMDMKVVVQEQVSRILVVYSGFSVPETITDAIFTIQE